jgi:hypothetical protein
MVAFGGFGFDTVGGMRNASREGKAKKVADKMSATGKPVTNTSGTSKPKGGNGGKQLMKQIEFGQKFGNGMGAVAGFMGMPFTSRIGGKPMTVDVLNQQIVQPGSVIKPPAASQPAAKKPVTKTSGIDAPAPDTGWRPSGVNTALGLQQTQMGVPLQETVGVSKRRR